jgi:hypothetical protein
MQSLKHSEPSTQPGLPTAQFWYCADADEVSMTDVRDERKSALTSATTNLFFIGSLLLKL